MGNRRADNRDVMILALQKERASLRHQIRTAFLAAVQAENPCPFCFARTDNVWPFCVHFAVCIVKDLLSIEECEKALLGQSDE